MYRWACSSEPSVQPCRRGLLARAVGGARQDGCMSVRTSDTGLVPGFSEATRAWFGDAFAGPTPAQAEAGAAIGRGETTLVIAPPGSGKTLAAFLWAIDKLATEPAPADPRQRCRVLYISPLKALAVDIERNLRSPLAGVGQAARRLSRASGAACAPATPPPTRAASWPASRQTS